MSVIGDLRSHWETLLASFAPPPGGAPLPDGYEDRSASEKRDELHQRLRTPYTTLPTESEGDPTSMVDEAFLQATFTHLADEMPPANPRGGNLHPRPKLIHCFGVCGLAELKLDDPSRFSGLLACPSLPLVVRLSNGQNPRSPDKTFVPGVAIKALVDGKPSRNLVFGGDVDGQSGTAFFASALHSWIGCPTSWQLVVLNAAFEQATADPAFNRGVPQGVREMPCRHLCDVRPDGTAVPDDDVKAPLALQLRPTAAITAWWASQSDAAAVDFRTVLGRIPAGTALYDVLEESPAAPPPGEVGRGPATPVKVGQLVLTTSLVASPFGDRRLFFAHPLRTVDVGEFPRCPVSAPPS